MADIQFYESDSESSSDADVLLSDVSDGYDSDCCNLDAGLSPIQKLEKYIESEHSYNRQIVIRGILDTLQQVMDSRQDVERVFDAIVRLSNDSDDMIRVEMVEHIPIVAEFSRSHNLFCDMDVVSAHLLPIVLQFLNDPNSQARKTGHASLLQLINCKLLSQDEIEKFVVPVIMSLADPESIDDFRTDAVTLMSRLAPLVGKDLTERAFLNRFAQMCSDALFHVRKVCAANFGEICQVVGQQNTENCLLPKYYYLCEDGVWGVRNACAECFVQVSTVCSSEVRRNELTQLFVSLLCDQSRWVRLAAFQALGGFISTFADPQFTGLQLTQDGHVIYKTPYQQCITDQGVGDDKHVPMDTAEDDQKGLQLAVSDELSADELRTQAYTRDVSDTAANYFDSFLFWRVAPLTVDQPSILAACGDIGVMPSVNKLSLSETTMSESVHQFPSAATEDKIWHCHYESTSPVNISKDLCQREVSGSNSVANNSSSVTAQNIVPPELLSHYMSMIEPARAQTVDPEIMRQCAFSFPAVAFTLGRSNWHCIQDLYRTLARDMQWKVRRTLAFSIHQLAAILGEDLTVSDLVPIFDEFVKDLDEVRIGVLKHLADFLKVLHGEVRSSYLAKLSEFLKIDNCRNWRFRFELAEQLPLLVDLFSVREVYSHIRPIAFILSDDHVAEIRHSSLKAMSSILKRLRTDDDLWLEFVEILKCRLANHQQSSYRQMFLLLCCYILEDESVEVDTFAVHLLPAALARFSDSVPNTRIGLARLLHRHVLTNARLTDQRAAYYDQLSSVVSALKNDPDRDVRYIMANCPVI